jgi:hypothetical protein
MTVYLVLYVATLALHAGLVGYVLAGAGYAAVAALRGRMADPVAAILRDWLPFALGAAITAGVAPVLFIQILYQERFYTANLLLFHRWMSIVPVLIVAFYALYVHKSERFSGRVRAAAILVAAAGFVFVAWSWTENHLLSLDDGVWRDFYAAGRMVYGSDQLAPRLLMWLFAAMPTMAVGVAWQVRGSGDAASVRRLGVLALVGIAGSTACAAWLWTRLPAASQASVETAVPWMAALAIGRAAELVAWVILVRRPASGALVLASGGASLALVAGVAVRESIRLIHLETVRPRVAAAGGGVAFAIAAALMVAALVWLARRISRELRA